MSTTWKTKYGPRRVRHDPPTLDEAIFAARGLTDDIEQQIDIAAGLMEVSAGFREVFFGYTDALEMMIKQVEESRRDDFVNEIGIFNGYTRLIDATLARNSKAAERLAEQFRERTVTKVYWGVVDGKLEPTEANWEDWLLKAPDEARVAVVDASVAGAKRAQLRYHVLRYLETYPATEDSALTPGPSPKGREENTLVEFMPITGRTHQIRAQAAARGAPC